jgi:Ca2+/H+ antiporter
MKTIINIKSDKAVKEAAREVARELGVPLGTIINAYLKQFVRTREVYLSSAPIMTVGLEKLVETARRDYAEKKNLSPVFSSVKDAIGYLESK